MVLQPAGEYEANLYITTAAAEFLLSAPHYSEYTFVVELPSLLHFCSNLLHLMDGIWPQHMEWEDKLPSISVFFSVNTTKTWTEQILACLSCSAEIERDLKAALFAACNSCYRCWLWPRVSSPNALTGLSVKPNPTWNVSIIMDLLLLHQRAVRTAQRAVPKMSSNHERCKWSSIKCNFLCGFSHLEQIPSMIIQEECL